MFRALTDLPVICFFLLSEPYWMRKAKVRNEADWPFQKIRQTGIFFLRYIITCWLNYLCAAWISLLALSHIASLMSLLAPSVCIACISSVSPAHLASSWPSRHPSRYHYQITVVLQTIQSLVWAPPTRPNHPLKVHHSVNVVPLKPDVCAVWGAAALRDTPARCVVCVGKVLPREIWRCRGRSPPA